jgi:hypothetical protein
MFPERSRHAMFAGRNFRQTNRKHGAKTRNARFVLRLMPEPKVKSGTSGSVNGDFRLCKFRGVFKRGECLLASSRWSSSRPLSSVSSRSPRTRVAADCGGDNAPLVLRRRIGGSAFDCIVRAGAQPRLRLVLRALQTAWKLLRAACGRDLLCVRAANRVRSSVQQRWVYCRSSHVALWIAGDGHKS